VKEVTVPGSLHHPFQEWPDGRSWRLGAAYLVVELVAGEA
jgi:hypothetical protein